MKFYWALGNFSRQLSNSNFFSRQIKSFWCLRRKQPHLVISGVAHFESFVITLIASYTILMVNYFKSWRQGVVFVFILTCTPVICSAQMALSFWRRKVKHAVAVNSYAERYDAMSTRRPGSKCIFGRHGQVPGVVAWVDFTFLITSLFKSCEICRLAEFAWITWTIKMQCAYR